ncbi:MAG: hypothetical protein K8F24_00915, partial [Bacteroidales bacterium]|nr:hypothetical protein [Bacteroidales bacterium]
MKTLQSQLLLPKLALFWLLIFTVLRVIFLLYYHRLLQAEVVPFIEVLMVFPAAFWLDISTIGYLLILPFILLTAATLSQSRFPLKVIRYYSLIMIVLYVLLALGETGLYA